MQKKTNRRQFISFTASAALFARPLDLFAQSYDLIVRGGRVIDPSLNIDTIADVAVASGRIVAVSPNIGANATEEIDATDRIVMPGLLDIHGHYAQDAQGPHICLSDGVTGWVDAGSAGADGIDEVVAIARSAPQPARVLINIGRRGVIPEGDTADLALADVELAKAAIARNRDYVVGVKARMTSGVTVNDLLVIRRAQEVASFFNLPLMIHMGQSESAMSELVAELKPGDIVTHMYAPPPNAIIDGSGQIFPEVLEARRRGRLADRIAPAARDQLSVAKVREPLPHAGARCERCNGAKRVAREGDIYFESNGHYYSPARYVRCKSGRRSC